MQYFAGRPDIQFVIRVHPGEVLTHGLSMVEVVRQVLPTVPEHIRLIGPKDKVNTYDLIEVADLGLVYTTTVGLEMAMSGVPVIVQRADPLPRPWFYLSIQIIGWLILNCWGSAGKPESLPPEPGAGRARLAVRLPVLL